MKNLKRLIIAAMFVVGAVLTGGSLAAYAQHGCGGHGGGASHTDHGKADATQNDETARPTIVDGVQVVKVAVTGSGYTPSRIVVREDMPVRLVFEQFSSSACASQVQIPSLDVSKVKLPKGKETPVEFTPTKAGSYLFTCGMEMLTGTLVVESSN
jgi:heme/copper-type cytochrome/quinol oxidase subunit 2